MDTVEVASVSIASAILIYFMVAIPYRLKRQDHPRKAKQDGKLGEAQAA